MEPPSFKSGKPFCTVNNIDRANRARRDLAAHRRQLAGVNSL
jgi:hypothetical protein